MSRHRRYPIIPREGHARKGCGAFFLFVGIAIVAGVVLGIIYHFYQVH